MKHTRSLVVCCCWMFWVKILLKFSATLQDDSCKGILRIAYNFDRRCSYRITYHFPIGTRIWITTLTPVYDQDDMQYIVASSRDVTEVETLRQENVQLLERLQSMFETHMAAMMIIDPITGKIKDANPSALQVLWLYQR